MPVEKFVLAASN